MRSMGGKYSESLNKSNSESHISLISVLLSNAQMKTNDEIRRLNMLAATARVGNAAKLAGKVGTSAAYLSQIKNRTPDSKSGTPKTMGDDMARRIEAAIGEPAGWIDAAHADEWERAGLLTVGELKSMSVDSKGQGSQSKGGASHASSSNLHPVIEMDDDDIKVPLVELRLSAGVAGFEVTQDGESSIGSVKLDRRFVESKHYDPSKLFALRVRGESMEPKLSAGDTVIIDTADTRPVDGGIFAVNYEGEAVIKRMSRDAGDWWLTSDNADQRRYHRKICRGGDCIIIGRAIQAMTSL